MWYFTWVLGLGFAVLLAIVNALWLEAKQDKQT
ncbi:MAG: cytochrome bd-I oxidase subunit CydX [Dechloromonas sp.]|nr:cytochrome bd-I oxidase subunit CydX [Dechloromonas sp.]